MSKSGSSTIIVLGFLTVAVVAAAWFLILEEDSRKKKQDELSNDIDDDDDVEDDDLKKPSKKSVDDSNASGASTTAKAKSTSKDAVTTAATTSATVEKSLNERIEELDQKGKKLYKQQQFIEAAQVFTEAIELLDRTAESESSSSLAPPSHTPASLARQRITLRNNRSAMYEKGKEYELAKADCYAILEEDPNHSKTRTRLLRILESAKQYQEALVQACAMQLLYMREHRDRISQGLPPTAQPPVAHTKLEELVELLLPDAVKSYEDRQYSSATIRGADRLLPGDSTILQLLKSFTGYNSWMAQAAKDGNVDALTKKLQDMGSLPSNPSATDTAQRASLLFKRGRRYVHDGHYALACDDFEDAFALAESNLDVQAAMPPGEYARLLEWVACARHWQYDLDSALDCLKKCSDLEPTNVELLLKQAGILQDAGKHDAASKLLYTAQGMDPNSPDVYFHRGVFLSELKKLDEAKADIERCILLRPDHVQARLRLVSILIAMEKISSAQDVLDEAEQIDPMSADVQLYRGELCFVQQDIAQASACFDKAITLDRKKSQAYANAAAILNAQATRPDEIPEVVKKMMDLLRKAVEVDSQNFAARVQLAQLLLGTATDIGAAAEVIQLLDDGLDKCRLPEGLKTLCSMRLLTVAQAEAAKLLKMEAFSMQ